MANNSLEHDDNCYSTIDENIFDDTSIIPLEKDSFGEYRGIMSCGVLYFALIT